MWRGSPDAVFDALIECMRDRDASHDRTSEQHLEVLLRLHASIPIQIDNVHSSERAPQILAAGERVKMKLRDASLTRIRRFPVLMAQRRFAILLVLGPMCFLAVFPAVLEIVSLWTLRGSEALSLGARLLIATNLQPLQVMTPCS